MKIALGADHGGFELKEKLKKSLASKGHELIDVGTNSPEACDYPKFAYQGALEVSEKRAERAILICKSGMGMCIVANKLRGIRATQCRDLVSAKLSRQHNDGNVLVLGSQDLNDGLDLVVETWLDTAFEGGRHQKRIDQIMKFEKKTLK